MDFCALFEQLLLLLRGYDHKDELDLITSTNTFEVASIPQKR